MMKHFIFTLLCITVLVQAKAQVVDNFADGNFSQNPVWIGDDSLFQITSEQLRLKGTTNNDAYLATANTITDSVTWQFFTRFALSPSTQNFSRFYILSDTSNLKGPLNGYYIQLGGVTGNSDSITFYKQAGNVRTQLLAGRPATVSKTNNLVRIKVFRDLVGNWQLWSDTLGGTNYTLEGTVFDNTFTQSKYLGWWMRYTSGNSQNHYLDDVSASYPIYDVTAPNVDSITIQGNNNILVYFNEAVDSTSAVQLNNYQLFPGSLNPKNVLLLGSKSVRLVFDSAFVSKQNYSLKISSIKDLVGNVLDSAIRTFNYYTPQQYDILISEFFPDPSPVIGLPDQEFIELYNNAGVAVNLKGYTLTDGSTTATLPNYLLGPDSFVVVCATANVALFNVFGPTVGVSNFPSLNNTGDNIILADASTQIIHQLSYDLSWYHDDIKDDGGWSIELKSTKQLCKEKQNYTSSVATQGGTPGTINSVWNPLPDVFAPYINYTTLVNNNAIKINFSEALNTNAASIVAVNFTPNISIASVSLLGLDTLLITTQSPLVNKTTYTITLTNVRDCSGNDTSLTTQISYLIADTAVNYDVLISEIMADPDPVQQLPNTEYVELYNRSNKIINLKGWALTDPSSKATLPDFLLMPDSFITITSSSHGLPFDVNVLRVSSFPSLGNDADQLTLFNNLGQVIHAVSYTSAWYIDALKRAGGWSLELVDPKNPCGINNWKTSTNPRGGTPSKQNSVRGLNPDNAPPQLIRAYLRDANYLELHFNEPLDSTSFAHNNFTINNSINPLKTLGTIPFYSSTVLQFTNAFVRDEVYQITIDSLRDCAGNIIQNYRGATFGLPYLADSNQLHINEVLFNPKTGGADFVELYNSSDKLIDVKDLLLAKRDSDGNVDQVESIAQAGFTIEPNGYLVITPDPTVVQQHYYCKYPENMIKANVPSMNDDAGNVLLLNTQGVVFDEFVYSDKMHVPLLDDKDGVSLERIDFNRATNDQTNWTSAAAAVNYATPTYRNSQYLNTERSENVFELQPKTISPDGDGYEDLMNINYLINDNGYTGTLTIYNAAGQEIKQLFKNSLLAPNGTYTWDGTTKSGQKAPVGLYVFYFEIFNLNGDVKSYKTVGVVAAKL